MALMFVPSLPKGRWVTRHLLSQAAVCYQWHAIQHRKAECRTIEDVRPVRHGSGLGELSCFNVSATMQNEFPHCCCVTRHRCCYQQCRWLP